MLVNKYNLGRRLLYRLYGVLPGARLLKRASLPRKVRKLQGIVTRRRAELEECLRRDGRHPLFSHIEIETVNRCNGECGFCPVNRHLDPRPAARMPEDLFRSIIGQLRDLDYQGVVYPYSNNEPLLDTRIVDFIAHAREMLPRAKIFIYTNGLLLTRELFQTLAPLVDDFTINNYCDDFRLAPHIEDLNRVIEADPALYRKTKVVMRYRQELMTSRGGQSPNKQDILPQTLPVGCLLPSRQVVVRPDGKLSLCCNDAVGKMTLGDLRRESLAEAWWGSAYVDLRNRVLAGRDALDLCRHCDTLHF
ncbi:MAG: SPASM domain-containing protein [Planctomycetes bacterium]|nr:SPASM domain-containing protein [Planctomycetota bacterium]